MVAIPIRRRSSSCRGPIDEHGHPIGAKVARMICDVVTPDGAPYEGDPRYVLAQALERMKSIGFDTFNVGPELEYFLFEDDKGTETLDEGGYFAMTAQDAATEVRNDTIHALESVGIPIEYHHHEVGPSQHEIDMRYADALAMADYTITYRLDRQGGRRVARLLRDLHAEAALRRERLGHAHPHVALHGRPQPVLRPARPSTTSRRRRRRSSPVCSCTPARCPAVLAQWVNSYKRLVPGYEAPVYVAWSQRNRSALDPDPALQAGLRAGDAGRDPLPRSRPATRTSRSRRCSTPVSRGSSRATSCRIAMDDEPLPALRRASGASRASSRSPSSLGEAIDELAASDLDDARARRPHLPALRRAQAARVGRVPRPGHGVGEGEVPGRAVTTYPEGRERPAAAAFRNLCTTSGTCRDPAKLG